jgi:tetratricopeptide (TPR) repeat protein
MDGMGIVFMGVVMLAACFLVVVQAEAATDPAVQSEVLALTASLPPITTEMRADIMMARKRFREAIDLYRQAGLNSPLILNKTGMAFYQLDDLPHAKKYYELAVKAKPDYAQAINNLGTVDYAQKNYRRAIHAYKNALRLEPRSAAFLSNLGTAWFARKNYAQAFELYQEAMKIDPEIFEYRDSQGATLVERDVAERAKFHFYLAKTYAKAGMTDRALPYLRKALEEGFKDRAQIVDGPEFAPLKDNDEFIQIIAMEPTVL